MTTSQSASGEAVETWSTLATVWAQRQDQAGNEAFRAGAERAMVGTVYRIRYRSDLKARDRLVDASETYDIESIALFGRNDGLDLRCRKEQQ